MKKETYNKKADIFKALSDSNRLQIIDMLSFEKELCACKILEKFNITQPTLSHHMKILSETGIVNSYKDSNWVKYTLNKKKFTEIQEFIKDILNSK